MSALFQTPQMPQMQTPPAMPSKSDPQIQKSVDDKIRLAQTHGRASNYLADPTKNYSDKSSQQFLGSI